MAAAHSGTAAITAACSARKSAYIIAETAHFRNSTCRALSPGPVPGTAFTAGNVPAVVWCNAKKALNTWHRRGTQQTGNTYHQPNRRSTDTPHRPSIKHYRKGSPGDAWHQLTQQPCTLQHSNNAPSSPSPNRVITRSSQPTQPAAKPSRNTQAGWPARARER